MEDSSRPSWYRFRYVGGAKPVLLITERRWFWYIIRWMPQAWGFGERVVATADSRHREAMARFVDAIKTAEQALIDVERHKDDVKMAQAYVDSYRPRSGISDWHQFPRIPREEEIPDLSDEFKKLEKRFASGMRFNAKSKLGTPGDATRSRYHWGNLPHMKHEGAEFDHEIAFDPSRLKQDNQNQGQSKRQQKRNNQQNQNG